MKLKLLKGRYMKFKTAINMKSNIATAAAITMVGLLSTSCGGGGGGEAVPTVNTPATVTYTGATTPAAITVGNTNNLSAGVAGGNQSTGLLIGAVPVSSGSKPPVEASGKLKKLATALIRTGIQTPSVAAGAVQQMNQTYACPLSGTQSFVGQVDTVALTATATISFNNCTELNGSVANGSAVVNMTMDQVTLNPLTMNMSFNAMSMSDPQLGGITMTGSIAVATSYATNTDTATINLATQDLITGRQNKMQNMMMISQFDIYNAPTTVSDSMSGRFFDSVHGYVDVQTITPLFQNLADAYPLSGQLILTGGNLVAGATKVRLTALSATQVLLEGDTTGDGNYDYSSGAMAWTALQTL